MAALLADRRRMGAPVRTQAGLSAAVVADHDEVAGWLNGFWGWIEGRARRGLVWGERLTLDTFADAVLRAPEVHGLVRDASDLAASHFTAGEQALLVPRSSIAPGMGPSPIKDDGYGVFPVKAAAERPKA